MTRGHSLKRVTLVATVLVTLTQAAASEVAVSVVSDRVPGPAASHGLKKLIEALRAKDVPAERAAAPQSAKGKLLIVAGLASGSGPAARLLRAAGTSAPSGAEALVIRHTQLGGKPALAVAGSDDRGLMYALLDVADRVGWASDPQNLLSEVKDAREKPAVAERALSKYTMHRSNFESYFHDEEYWARYLDTLAENRFNTFALLFGYENWGYFAPPYPYLFDVEGYPDVRVVGLSNKQQQRNLKSLNRIVEMTHERGLNFTLGIWDHLYRGGVQGPRRFTQQPTPGLVWGLTGENLVPYTTAALAELLREVPNLDAIQFRMHGESGLKREEMKEFWENIYEVMKRYGGDIRFDARAKNFPDSLIEAALDTGINIRMCTKYWAEQMGLPFHPTHINRQNQFDRRHGYADMLRYPQRYKMHWRLWNGGTARILLWADPEYVRRFADSTHLYDGEGFEVNEPVATKMQDHLHDMEPFELLRPQYQYYDWEFERYWHFFQVFGRVGYNPETPAEVWQREFQRRFGREAAPYVEQGIHRASQVLPRILATCFPYNRFPMTRGWVEKQRRGDLPVYAKAEASDIQQFLSFDDAAQYQLDGKGSAKVWPQQTAAWFARASSDILKLVDQAEKQIGTHRNKEFDSTIVDLKILSNLALYHSRRPHAGVSWNLFQRTGDLNALDDAIRHESRAIQAWEKIVEAAGDVYHDDLMMGRRSAGLSGHWKDELVELNEGLEELQRQRKNFSPALTEAGPSIAHVPIRKNAPGQELVIRAMVSGKAPISSVSVTYGDQRAYSTTRMKQTERFLYRAVIPGLKVTPGLRYLIEAVDDAGRRASFPPEGEAKAIAVAVTRDNSPPVLAHDPIQSAPAAKQLRITAQVRDPSGVQWVRLRYRSVNQHQDYRTLAMLPTGKGNQYQAQVPGEHILPKWDFMYLIEVMDSNGNGKIYPDLERETPYVVVKLRRGASTH